MQVTFSQEYGELVLLDASQEEIRKALDGGEELVFKGSQEDDAVLCSANATYQLVAKETSNELLFMQRRGGAEGDEACVEGVSRRVLEPVRIPPRLDVLRSMLLATSSASDDDDDNSEEEEEGAHHKRAKRASSKLTFEALVHSVQASELEIKSGLAELLAYETTTTGGWRMPTREQMSDIVAQFLLCLVAHRVDNGPAIALLTPDLVCEWLSEFPGELVRAVLFSSQDLIDVNRLLRFKAESLLLQCSGGGLPVSKFTQRWAKEVSPLSLPEGEGAMDLVQEFALVVSGDVRYFSRSALPRNAKARMQQLFAVMPFWTEKELGFYLQGVDGGSATAIARFCRITKQGYGAKIV